MDDIAPGLLLRIRSRFRSLADEDKEIQALHQKITDGNAAYADASRYAELVGDALSRAFLDNLGGSLPDGKLYYNIASRIIQPMLEEDHSLVSDAAAAVQKRLNEKAGISIRPQKAPVNQDRIDGIIDKVSGAEQFEDVRWVLEEPVKNFSMNVVDETIRVNADFHYRVGLTPKIIRKPEHGACKWCRNLAGEFDYPNVPKDVYRRHENCRCIVEYDPGGSKRRQNVHTKQWTSTGNDDIIKKRQTIGLETQIKHEFRNRKLLADHYKRHGRDYGTISMPEYLRMASELAEAEVSDDVAMITLPDGVTRKFRFSTNDFVAINEDGSIRTFFKAEYGREYWESERKKAEKN